jgi:hypothetical protein
MSKTTIRVPSRNKSLLVELDIERDLSHRQNAAEMRASRVSRRLTLRSKHSSAIVMGASEN